VTTDVALAVEQMHVLDWMLAAAQVRFAATPSLKV
jgi:hypothetical protein